VALVLPVIALLLLAVVQVGLVVRDQVLVTHAAREAARAAAVDPDPEAPARAAEAAADLEPARLSVTTGDRGEAGTRVRVEVRYASPTTLPLVGRLVPDVSLTAAATMRVE
jgi:Flp pilus assembly protein TadG